MSIRTERVASVIQRELADILQQSYGDQLQPLVTVTNVSMTKDLGIAYVNLSVLGDDEPVRQSLLKRVQALGDEIRLTLGGRIRNQLKSVPELKFFLDQSQQRAQHMDDLFAKIREERQARDDSDSA
jgi:ribosome-binding factor A